jgi:hypothetical protein
VVSELCCCEDVSDEPDSDGPDVNEDIEDCEDVQL